MAILYKSDGTVDSYIKYVGLDKYDIMNTYFASSGSDPVVEVFRRTSATRLIPEFYIDFAVNGNGTEYIYAENIAALFQFFAAAKPMIDLIMKNAELY